jgi:hypothetical protein
MSLATNIVSEGQSIEPFRRDCAQYHERNLSIIPCGKDNGKKAVIKWGIYQDRLVSQQTLDEWTQTYPACNIGLITGHLSRITVVDSDEPDTPIVELFRIFGPTPVVVKTPSGGCHLYYRYNGEKSQNGIIGRKIDLRGQGGYVIAPPSINPLTGVSYSFERGNLFDIDDLPCARLPDAIQINRVRFTEERKKPANDTGTRNDSLFRFLMGIADSSEDEELLSQAMVYNDSKNSPPLPDPEVHEVVASVYKYKHERGIFKKGTQSVPYKKDIHVKLWHEYPDAACLMYYLRAAHFLPGKQFSICSKAINSSICISLRRLRKAINILLSYSIIRCVHQGGSRRGDTNVYVWVSI